MPNIRDDQVERAEPRGRQGSSSSDESAGALRRWMADEQGSVSLEYLMVTLTCGLLAAIGLITTIGPSLVSMWSERRACLYDGACAHPPQLQLQPQPRARPLP